VTYFTDSIWSLQAVIAHHHQFEGFAGNVTKMALVTPTAVSQPGLRAERLILDALF